MTVIPDLAPGLPSRIVKGTSTIITERGPVAGGKVTLSLSQAILSVPDKTYLEASSVSVPLDTNPDGTWSVRLPTVAATVEPRDSWTITVKYSTRPYPFEIRVPEGTGSIDIADIGEVHGVAPEFAGWVVTGMQIGTVAAGTTAAARISGSAPTLTLDLTLPKGDKGDRGNTGPANSLSVGTVTTGPAGGTAAAAIMGTAPSQSLALTIPRGDKGATGDRGPVGPALSILGTKPNTAALPATGTLGDAWLIGNDLHVWNGTAWQNVGPVRGPQGEVGKTPQLAATAQTLVAGAAASVAVGGTTDAPAFTLGIPRGQNGASITKVEQTAPTTVAVTVTDPTTGPTVTTWTLPVAQTTYTEARPGVWQPLTSSTP